MFSIELLQSITKMSWSNCGELTYLLYVTIVTVLLTPQWIGAGRDFCSVLSTQWAFMQVL
jgi:hypothetical protein